MFRIIIYIFIAPVIFCENAIETQFSERSSHFESPQTEAYGWQFGDVYRIFCYIAIAGAGQVLFKNPRTARFRLKHPFKLRVTRLPQILKIFLKRFKSHLVSELFVRYVIGAAVAKKQPGPSQKHLDPVQKLLTQSKLWLIKSPWWNRPSQ